MVVVIGWDARIGGGDEGLELVTESCLAARG